MNIENFEMFLRQGNMAENTIAAYLYAVKEYYSRHKELNKRNLLVYKTYLIEKFKPKTVNLRIQAMNKYLDCMGKSRLRLKSVKVQQRSYLENVISNADYVFLKNKLKKEENQEWYFVVRFLAATGARVSELIQMKVEHVQIGYFAQNQAQLLDEKLTIFQTIDNVATGEMRLKVNDLLGAFMFGGETSEKYVKVLSGGERSRLAMIKLLLEPVNLLILDEPTNHLDMQSKDVLKEAIKAFDGTAIIVSHDREFLDGLVDKVYEFAGGKVREHLGGIYDYLRAHNAESISQALANQVGSQNMSSAGSPSSSSSSSADSSEASSGKLSYAEHKEQQKKIRKAEKAVKECETKIEKLETRKAEIDALLMKPENATNMELVTEYTELMKSLDEENENWMMLSEELEEIKNS